MSVDVVMPQMGESIFEGTITKWLKKPGEKVERDEPLFEISTDKVDAEIPAPSAGVLKEIKVAEGQTVPVQTVVAVIDSNGAGAATAAAAPRQKPKRRPKPEACRAAPDEAPEAPKVRSLRQRRVATKPARSSALRAAAQGRLPQPTARKSAVPRWSAASPRNTKSI